MFRRVLRVLDYQTSAVTDVMSHVLKKDLQYDHVAIDLGQFAGAALRATRDLEGAEKDQEVVKYVAKAVTGIFMRRISIGKSVALLLDGVDPYWKFRRTRKYPGKRQESKFYRCAASPVMFNLEDRIRSAVIESRDCPSELLLSGCCTPGPTEGKMSAWALDIASAAPAARSDTFCLIGATDLFLSCLALTPFYNLTNMTLNMGELKYVTLAEVLEWLGLQKVMESGDSVRLARIRTDVTFLYMLSHGLAATDLPGLTNLVFKDVMGQYHTQFVARNESERYLFEENGSDLTLSVDCLVQLLNSALKKPVTSKMGDVAASDYLEAALQSHAMLCCGGIRDYSVSTREVQQAKTSSLRVDTFVSHLRSLGAVKRKASVNRNFALTAAEYLLCSAHSAQVIEQVLPVFTGGHTLPAGIAQELVDCAEPEEALEKAKGILSLVKCEHRALVHSPTHCWLKKAGAQGPPPGWVYYGVHLGKKSDASSTRAQLNSTTTDAVVEKTKRNYVVGFDASTKTWKDVPLPVGVESPSYPSSLKLVTWNVQFDRYSKKTTPLGKPGIDWCTPTRYGALSSVLSKTDADVIAMQESEVPWWEYLSHQAWVQDNYYFSCESNGDAVNPWGLVMLVHRRLPLVALTHTNVPGYSGHSSPMPCLTIPLNAKKSLCVSAIHLLAPYNQNNINQRVNQIDTLLKRLSPKFVGDDVVCMGDFNDYPSDFYRMPEAMKYKDAWEVVHGAPSEGSQDGYTINGNTNSYTNLIIEKEFFGRADRMLYNSSILVPTHAQLLGTKPVRAELAIDTCPEYLFPSDHYGVCCEFDVLPMDY